MSCGIFSRLERIGEGLLRTADAVFDERKTKKDVVKELFNVGKNTVGLGFQVTGCAIKNTPKAIKAVKEIKDEIRHELTHKEKIDLDNMYKILEDKNVK